MSVNFKHPSSGLIKECPEGFSWTTFFFNGFVPAIRGMWGVFAITFLTSGLAGIYFMFTINKMYATSLLEKGYVPASEIDINKLKSMGIGLTTTTAAEPAATNPQIEEQRVAS